MSSVHRLPLTLLTLPSHPCTLFIFSSLCIRVCASLVLTLCSKVYSSSSSACLSVLRNEPLPHFVDHILQQWCKTHTRSPDKHSSPHTHWYTHAGVHCRHTNQICLKCGTLKEERAPVGIKYSCDVCWAANVHACAPGFV